MSDYDKFPPLSLFNRVLVSSPASALLYVTLYKLKSKAIRFTIAKNTIKKQFILSITLFRNKLFELRKLELLTFDETIEGFGIVLYENNKK